MKYQRTPPNAPNTKQTNIYTGVENSETYVRHSKTPTNPNTINPTIPHINPKIASLEINPGCCLV